MKRTKDIALAGVFLALMIIGAYIKITIPTPFMVMHITLQLFIAIMCGLCLPLRLSASIIAIYILIGLMGLPVFAMGGGISYIARPTFGYIIGFELCAMACGYLSDKFKPGTNKDYSIIGLIGMSLYYLSGIVYYYLSMRFILLSNIPFMIIIFNCFIVSIVPDLIITFFASISSKRIKAIRRNII